MASYVPPPLDVNVTCFIAQEGRRFDTDPEPWRRLVPNVVEGSVPGTHTTAVVPRRDELAHAIGQAIRRAAARWTHL